MLILLWKRLFSITYALPAVLLAPAIAAAQPQAGIKPFMDPTGFVLISKNAVHDSGGAMLYGGGAGANWHFTQFGAQSDLPPLRQNGDSWSSADEWESIQAVDDGGVFSETIQQNGTSPCVIGQDRPSEFDLFIEPNGKRAGDASAVNPVYGKANRFPPMSALASFHLDGVFTVNRAAGVTGADTCKVNHANAGIGLILIDNTATPRQMFWYTLQLMHVCVPPAAGQPADDYAHCTSHTENPQPTWYWTGQTPPNAHLKRNRNGDIVVSNFAISDALPSYGIAPIVQNTPTPLSFDVLKRLSGLITSGNYGIDPDLSHWRLAGVSFGDEAWGRTFLSTTWQGFVPVWTVKGQ